MVIDIKRMVIRTQMRRFITLIGFSIVIIALLILSGHNDLWLGMEKFSWALIIGLFYLLSLIAESMLELNYIYFSDDNDKITMRYFSMSVLNKKKYSIVIPRKELGGYEIRESLWGLKKKIILLHRFNGKDAKYPPVSISGLNKEEFQTLIKTLDRWKLQ